MAIGPEEVTDEEALLKIFQDACDRVTEVHGEPAVKVADKFATLRDRKRVCAVWFIAGPNGNPVNHNMSIDITLRAIEVRVMGAYGADLHEAQIKVRSTLAAKRMLDLLIPEIFPKVLPISPEN